MMKNSIMSKIKIVKGEGEGRKKRVRKYRRKRKKWMRVVREGDEEAHHSLFFRQNVLKQAKL